MTGREHYAKAEQYAENALAIYAREDIVAAESAWHQQQSLVHSALALAAKEQETTDMPSDLVCMNVALADGQRRDVWVPPAVAAEIWNVGYERS